MKAIVSIIMGSTSDLPVMEKAAQFLDNMDIPFEMNALSAHRTPSEVEEFAKNAKGRGVKVILAGAGMAAALPGVIAAQTTLPVIGIPMKSAALEGMDALLAIVQMPPGIPCATVAIDGAKNAAILAAKILAVADDELDKITKEMLLTKKKIITGSKYFNLYLMHMVQMIIVRYEMEINGLPSMCEDEKRCKLQFLKLMKKWFPEVGGVCQLAQKILVDAFNKLDEEFKNI